MNHSRKDKEVDRMIDEGLGSGEINSAHDKEQLNSPISDEDKKKKKDNEMVDNLNDAKKLGKEMKKMKTNKETKKDGKDPDPKQ